MENGSWFQQIPLRTSKVKDDFTYIRLTDQAGQKAYRFGADFGLRNRSLEPGRVSGDIVFLGLGLHAPDQGCDDFAGRDLQGKIAIITGAGSGMGRSWRG